MVGAALEKSLTKKYFRTHFFSLQSYRYGVSYEYSSRQVLKKNMFSCLKRVFLRFFFYCKNGFLAGIHAVLTVGWPSKPLVDCILHSYMYIHSVSAPWYAVDGHMGPPLG
jgi:hypothetical protein